MANKDLFAQAIADAKKLKEISMANAKQAIEEAFAPRIQEMFRTKLSEMDKPVEEDLMEDDTENMEEGEMEGAGMHNPKETGLDEVTLEEILAELELEEGDETSEEEPIKEAEKEEKDDEEGEEAAEEVAELSVDQFESMIRDILQDVLSQQGGKAPEEGGEEPAGDMEGGEEKGKEGDVIPLDEILANLLAEDENVEEGLGDVMSKIGSGLKKARNVASAAVHGLSVKDIEACRSQSKNRDEYLACLSEKGAGFTSAGTSSVVGGMGQSGQKSTDIYETEMTDEGLSDVMSKIGSGLKKARNVASAAVHGLSVKDIEACRSESKNRDEYLACLSEKGAGFTSAGTSKVVGGMGQSGETSTDIREAIKTINYLKSQLSEVNLLNAKLLYVNKLFKAKNLSEAQKVKAITAFDRATTIKEAKNIYAVLSESLTSNATPAKAPLKESLGFASKPVGSAPARPIVEADAYVHRMQQLAGLRQPNI